MQVVSGRLVNAYSTTDWMLGVAFRARYALYGIIMLSCILFMLYFVKTYSCNFNILMIWKIQMEIHPLNIKKIEEQNHLINSHT